MILELFLAFSEVSLNMWLLQNCRRTFENGSVFAPILLVGEAQNLRFSSTDGSIFSPIEKIPPKQWWGWSARFSPIEKSGRTAMGLKHEVFSHQKIPPNSDGTEARGFLPLQKSSLEGDGSYARVALHQKIKQKRWKQSASISPIEKQWD